MADPNRRQQLSTVEEALQQTTEEHFDVHQIHDSISLHFEDLNEKIKSLQKETSVSIMQANMKIEQQSNVITSLHNEIGRLKSENENLEHVNAELSKNYSDLQANQRESTTGALRALKGLSKEKAQLKRALEVEKLRNQELLEKLVKYENDTKVVNEFANKAEGEVIETQSLRKEIESWKAKAHSLTQQLKNFGADSFKRLMAEKKHLRKQATVQPSQPPQSVPTSVSSSFPSSIEVSEASTSESQANQFSLGPTTSTGGEEKNKRTFDDDACDEPSTSSSLKKFKSAPMISTTITTAGQSDEEAEPDEEGKSELREYEEQYNEEDGLKVVNEDEEQSESEVDLAF